MINGHHLPLSKQELTFCTVFNDSDATIPLLDFLIFWVVLFIILLLIFIYNVVNFGMIGSVYCESVTLTRNCEGVWLDSKLEVISSH